MAGRRRGRKNKTKFSVKAVRQSTIFGVILGMISIASVVALLYLTFISGSEATLSYAFAGLLTSFFSVTGLVLSILCLNDHYQPHFWGWLGFLTNGIAVLAMAGILYLGMF